jgi:hypothetical protein
MSDHELMWYLIGGVIAIGIGLILTTIVVCENRARADRQHGELRQALLEHKAQAQRPGIPKTPPGGWHYPESTPTPFSPKYQKQPDDPCPGGSVS